MTFTARYYLSEFFSVLGNSAAAVILPLVLLAKTGDPLAAGSLALICAVPQFLAGLFGGAVLDLCNRRSVSICANCISALSVAMLPIIEWTVGLNFGWFVLFGLLEAIGDIPGMTARDVLFPAVVARDGKNLQQSLAIVQAIDSLAVIIGPALAALLMQLVGDINGLWLTAILSFAAAVVTLTLPKDIAPASSTHNHKNALTALGASLKEGLSVICQSRQIIAILLLSTGVAMVIGGFQGLILPVYFTEQNTPERLGIVLSALAVGTLVGPLLYATLTEKLTPRLWYVGSLLGTAFGIGIMAILPRYSMLLLGAFLAGALSGPFSSLLAMQLLHAIPEEKRGAVFGLQNAAQLITLPAGIFLVSIAVDCFGAATAALGLGVLFGLVVLWAIVTPHFHHIDG